MVAEDLTIGQPIESIVVSSLSVLVSWCSRFNKVARYVERSLLSILTGKKNVSTANIYDKKKRKGKEKLEAPLPDPTPSP